MSERSFPQKCLLISPLSFYSFGATLKKCLEEDGYTVKLDNDEFPANMLGKMLGKVGALRILRRLTLAEYKRRYDGKEKYDLVIIVKGRGVSRELIDFLRTFAHRVIAYNFDSFKFNPSPLDWLGSVDRYCTFDIKDAQDHDLALVHLFSALPENSPGGGKKYDVSAVMKNHSHRLSYTDKVLSSIPNASRFIYIYEPNYISFFLKFFKYPYLYVKYWRYIHFTPLSYEAFFNLLSQSRVTIDYAHPSQTGITIRCFEALSLGVAIITNNAYVFTNNAFDKRSVIHLGLRDDRKRLTSNFEGLLQYRNRPSTRSVREFTRELVGDIK